MATLPHDVVKLFLSLITAKQFIHQTIYRAIVFYIQTYLNALVFIDF